MPKEEKKVITEQELIKEVEDLRATAKKDALELQWHVNIAYYLGKQWVAVRPSSKTLWEPPKRSDEVRHVSNRIQPVIRTALAKITRSKPLIDVLPASSEDDDVNAARTSKKVLNYEWKQQKMRGKVYEFALWALTTGNAFLKVFWNAKDGETVRVDEGGKRLNTGEVNCEVCSPFEIKLDPSATKWEEVNWAIHERVRTVEYVKEMYGKDVPPEKDILQCNLLDNMMKDVSGFGMDINYPKAENSVVVRELWQKPNAKYPKGRKVTWANNVLLDHRDSLPYDFPFVHFRDILVPGRVWGKSIIEDLIPPQKGLNWARSALMQNMRLMGNIPWLIPKGSVNENDLTNEPGAIVAYDQTKGAPQRIPPPPVPPFYENEVARYESEIEQISGQHDVSQGRVTSDVKSGLHYRLALEQDETKLAPTTDQLEQSIEAWAILNLKLIQQFWKEPRLIRVIGKNKKVEAFDFTGADVGNNHDVVVQAGSALPQSKTARQQFILDLYEAQIITDKQVAMKLLEFGDIEDIYEDLALDINQAQSEHKRWLAQGKTPDPEQMPVVRDFYNHAVHIMEHNKFRKQDEYEQLPMELRAAIDAHVLEHEGYAPKPSVLPESNQAPQGAINMPMTAGLDAGLPSLGR